jgi:hypothetical protein
MSTPKTQNESPEELQGAHKVLLGIATFFFIYLVVEGMIIVPGLFSRYGWH